MSDEQEQYERVGELEKVIVGQAEQIQRLKEELQDCSQCEGRWNKLWNDQCTAINAAIHALMLLRARIGSSSEEHVKQIEETIAILEQKQDDEAR